MKSGYRMTRRLLETGTDFTALYATADTLAMGACRALKESGVRVPEDCSIMGFDGLEAGRVLYSQPDDPWSSRRRRWLMLRLPIYSG